MANNQTGTMCPHGGEEMEYTLFEGTHIYSCPECPNVMIEYRFDSDIIALVKYLKSEHLLK